MRDALCQGHPKLEFFVERGGDDGPARRICEGALYGSSVDVWAREPTHGIWGGLSERQRRQLQTTWLPPNDITIEAVFAWISTTIGRVPPRPKSSKSRRRAREHARDAAAGLDDFL
jgi:hypothetical protein